MRTVVAVFRTLSDTTDGSLKFCWWWVLVVRVNYFPGTFFSSDGSLYFRKIKRSSFSYVLLVVFCGMCR